jgi:hypothetical protein
VTDLFCSLEPGQGIGDALAETTTSLRAVSSQFLGNHAKFLD